MNTSNFKWYNVFFTKEVRGYSALLIIFLIIASYLGHKTPFLISDLANQFSSGELIFNQSLIALFINFLFIYINRVLFQLTVSKYVREVIQIARVNVFKTWINASEVDSEKYPQGDIISRIINDTEAIRELITSGAFGLLIDLFFIVSCLFGFLKIQLFLGTALTIFEIIAIIVLILGSGFMRKYFIELRATQSMVNRTTANIVGGIRQHYFMNHHNFSLKKTESSFDLFLKAQNKVNAADAFYYAVAESLYPIILVFTSLFLPFAGTILAATLMALLDLIQRSINPIKEISGKIANIQRAHTGLVRLEEFLHTLDSEKVEKIDSVGNDQNFEKLNVAITHFSYASKNGEASQNFQLQDISFSGSRGELIGLVGLSGCGKSTILNILAGNLVLEHGNFQVNFKNKKISVLNKISQDWGIFRNQVSLVSQDSHIFSESLFFNLSLGQGTLEEFEKSFHFFIEHIPYIKSWGISAQTKINPSNLSLGQKQLLAGLRACYLKKNIILFDEISSAMDSELEFALRSLVRLLQSHSLTIIVAHRVETLKESDQILVLDKGRLIETGKHHELLKSSPIYQEFVHELSLS